MTEFLKALTMLDKVFVICAGVGGLLFVVRLALQFIGADSDLDVDTDFNTDFDVGGDSDTSFVALSFQAITVFFMMFGLTGLSLHIGFGYSSAIAMLGAIGAGLVSVWIIEKIMTSLAGLQSSGTMNMNNAIGQKGTIYLRIPPNGIGKASLTVQGSLKVLDAVSKAKEEIKTGERIVVVDLMDNTLVVEKDQ